MVSDLGTSLRYRKTESPSIDFYVEEINGVRGVYVVSPKILALDKPELFGVPFIFYVGEGQFIDSLPLHLRNTDKVVRQLRQGGVSYLSQEQYHELVRGFVAGYKLPDAVQVGEKRIPIENLVKRGYVPYSFGVNHDSDVLRNVRVRTEEEYRIMVEQILPRFRR